MTVPDREFSAEAPLASVERRLHAALVDRLITWGTLAGTAVLCWFLWWQEGDLWPGLLLTAGVVMVLWLAGAVVTGTTGRSLGRLVTSTELVDVTTHQPIGVRRALLRGLVCGIAGLPMAGLGLAALAWSALADADGLRRGLHDRWAGSVVLERAAAVADPVPDEVAQPAPHLVNLTALRLAPVPSGTDVGAGVGAVVGAGPEEPAINATAGLPAPTPDPTLDDARPAGTRVAGAPSPTASDRRAKARVWRLVADTGESARLEGLVLLGRNPEARAGETASHLMALHSDDMSLSKTHVAVQLARDGTPVAVDRGSTNGSILLRGGVSRDLSTGRAVTLLDGDRIRLGDRMVVLTAEPDEAPVVPADGRSPKWQ